MTTTSDPVPLVQAISSQSYSTDQLPRQKSRYRRTADTFASLYDGQAPEFYARAPGRVNVIGEHIDYCEFGVLPAAIEQDIIVAVRVDPSKDASFHVKLANTNKDYKPGELSFDANTPIPIDNSILKWSNYVAASFEVVRQELKQALGPPVTISLLYNGVVPSGAGLSSSAAMTVSSVVAALHALHALERYPKQRVTHLAVSAEHLCSISCGGMDQAASVFGEAAGLVHVDFLPELTATTCHLPTSPSVELVISNSLVVADKHLTSKYNYNLRLVEDRVAAALLGKHLGLALDTPTTFRRVFLQHNKASTSNLTPAAACAQLDELLAQAKQCLGGYENGILWPDVLSQLGGINQVEFKERFHPHFEIEADRLQVLKRTRHVLTEAKRVYQFRQLLEETDGTLTGDEKIKQLGQLMNESHDSCRDDYECSCPELDQLVDLGRKAWSLGSRVTGAGFGGSCVHLVLSKDVPEFVQTLREDFYNGLSVATVNDALFSTKPGVGAFVLPWKP